MSGNDDLELNSFQPLHTARVFSLQPVDSFPSNGTLPNTASPRSDVSLARSEPIVEQGSRKQDPERVELLEGNIPISPRESSWLSNLTTRLGQRNHHSPVKHYSEIPNVDEPSKVVRSSCSRLLALRHFSLVHLPAVAITVTLLSLYIAEVRWENPSVEVLNALQFAAKAHEGVILISLGDILLHRISHGLNNQDTGVPLGFISASFYLGAPFRYLVSGELWSPILHSIGNRRYHGTTGVMIILVIFLCVAASPLSAIAMIPRQIWWKNDDFSRDYNDRVTVQIEGVEHNTHLDSNSGPYWNRSREAKTLDAKTLQMMWKANLLKVPENLDYQAFQNTTYGNYNSEWRPISIANVDNMEIATCPTSIVAFSLGSAALRKTDIRTPNTPWIVKAERQASGSTQAKRWKQPIVAVECLSGELDQGVATFNPPNSSYKTILLSTKQYPALEDLNEKFGSTPGPIGYRYLGLRDTMELPVSTDMLFASVRNRTGKIVNALDLCLIYARWVEVEIWVEPLQSSDVRSHLPFSKDEAPSRITGAFGTSDFIYIDQEWMESIAATPSASFYNQGILSNCHYRNASCFASALALHVVDAISMGRFGGVLYNGDIDPQMDIMRFTGHFYTHSYDFKSSRGIPLAFSLLLLHVLMVLIHLATILVSKHPWQGSTWESFGDMLVLALRSKAPDGLDNDYEQAANSRAWTKTVFVKDIGNGGQLQIFLKDNKEFEELPQEGLGMEHGGR